MEFATENYLNELLLNTEANGFESAKEAFYECIANEGVGEVVGSVALGIVAVPLLAVAAVVAIAIIAVGAVLTLVFGILKFIINIPISIAKLIKNKSTASKYEKELENLFNVEGKQFGDAFCNYGVAAKDAIKKFDPYIKKMNTIDIANKDKSDFGSSDIESVNGIKSALEAKANDFDERKKLYNAAFDKIADKFKGNSESYRYCAMKFSDNSWNIMANACKSMTPSVKEYAKTLQNYQEKLKKTDAECKKAKAAGEKEVKLNSQAAIATENSNKILKSGNLIVKMIADWVKMCSNIVSNKNMEYESLSDENYNTIRNSAKDIEDNERNLELEKTGKAMANNLKEWASKQPHLQGQKSK